MHSIELYALASRYPLVSKSCWFADIVGDEIAAAAAALPAVRAAVLKERGRALDLETTVQELVVALEQEGKH